MTTFPADWTLVTLGALEAPGTHQNEAILRAWQQSTPLPPEASNPLGMPAGSKFAAPWQGTGYAGFVTMHDFYASISAIGATFAGKAVVAVLRNHGTYPEAWAAIRALGWPAVKTETDYPAALLDMCPPSFRLSVEASDAGARKTSGMVGGAAEPQPSLGQGSLQLNLTLGASWSITRALRNRQ